MNNFTATSSNLNELIYPDKRNPYYIVTPKYIRSSAGIRALHLLCHSLNRLGYQAYIVPFPPHPHELAVAPDLLTPVINNTLIQFHFENKQCPIIIYPETVAGNPFKSPLVVRYVLNFPGFLGGDKVYPASEICFGYSQVLADAANASDNVLFLPATDTRIFNPGSKQLPRSGSCFYADKYKNIHSGRLFDITSKSTEITRDLPDSQTPEEIADLFRHSEIFYCYENSALAIEAVLCGCPAVFLPNPYLTEVIAIKELGIDGFAWGTAPEEIDRAKATVEKGAQNYLRTYQKYWEQLERFVNITQERAASTPYVEIVDIPIMTLNEPGISFRELTKFCWHVVRHEGALSLLKKIIRKIGRLKIAVIFYWVSNK